MIKEKKLHINDLHSHLKKKHTHTQNKPKVRRRNKIIKGRHQRHKQYKINKKINETNNWFSKKTKNIDKLQTRHLLTYCNVLFILAAVGLWFLLLSSSG